MKSYVVEVREILINSVPLKLRRITLNVDGKVVTIQEAHSAKYRCSRLKFVDSEHRDLPLQLQTDGLKIVFSRGHETVQNVAQLRSHVDQVCGTTSQQTQKKRPSSVLDSNLSPAVEKRRTYALDSPGTATKYQRQIVSSVKKAPPPRTVESSGTARQGTPPRKTHHFLFGSPVPTKNNSMGRSKNAIGSTVRHESPVQHSQEFTLSQSQEDPVTAGKSVRADSSAKKRPNDIANWAKLFSQKNTSQTTSVALSPHQLPVYDSNLRMSQTQRPRESPAAITVTSIAKHNFETPPQKVKHNTFVEEPAVGLFSDAGDQTHSSNNLLKAFSTSRDPLNLGGVKNLGNTCFIGGVLQAMFCLDTFKKDLFSPFWTSVITDSTFLSKGVGNGISSSSSSSCVTELSKLMQMSSAVNKTPLNVLQFKDAVTTSTGKYKGFAQHDAHEFLCDLLNLVEEDLEKGLDELLAKHKLMLSDVNVHQVGRGAEETSVTSPHQNSFTPTPRDVLRTPAPATASSRNITAKDKNAVGNRPTRASSPAGSASASASAATGASLISRLSPCSRSFSSTVTASMTCTSCHQEKTLREQYKDFSLDIDDGSADDGSAVKLEKLFGSFFAKETRDLQCEKCKHSDAKVDVKTSISELPAVLCVQLKRFRHGISLNQFEKNSKNVSFPSLLNMKDFCSEELCSTAEAGRLLADDDKVFASVLGEKYDKLLHGSFVEARTCKPSTPSLRRTTTSSSTSTSSDGSLVVLTNTTVGNDFVEDGVDEDSLVWTCESCTFVNRQEEDNVAENPVCEVCDAHRYAREQDDSELDVGADSEDEHKLASIDASSIPFMYELVAVLRHVGAHSSAGHYTCDVKKQKLGSLMKTWQHCDDSLLTPITQKSVLEGQEDPYILFYQKC